MIIVTTEKRINEKITKEIDKIRVLSSMQCNDLKKIYDEAAWKTLKAVCGGLIKLRENTWDKDLVDDLIKYIEDNFKTKEYVYSYKGKIVDGKTFLEKQIERIVENGRL